MQRLPGGPTTADDRAVSDLISYVLTFSVLVAAVAIVSSVGFGQLEEIREQEQLNNAERAILLLERNVDDIQQGHATVRSSEIDLHAGSIEADFGGPGASNVTVAVNGTDVNETIQLNNLTFAQGDKRIAFEGGSVFTDSGTGNVIVEDGPELVCRDDVAVLSFVRLQGPANGTFLTGGVARITTRHNESLLHYPQNRSGTDSVADSTGVTVTVESDFEDGWATYFDETGDWTPLPGPELKYRCTGDGDTDMQVYVRQTTVNALLKR